MEMKLLRQRSWAVGAAVGLLLACSSKVDSGDDPGGGTGNMPGGGSTASGGTTVNPSGGSTVNPSGGAATGGTTGVAGSGTGGATNSNLCSSYAFWDGGALYPIGSKVIYNGAAYIAVN